jgi:hypothetical protein
MVKDTLRNAMEEDSDGLEATLSEVTDRISFRCILFRKSGLHEETITMVLLTLIEISSTRGSSIISSPRFPRHNYLLYH